MLSDIVRTIDKHYEVRGWKIHIEKRDSKRSVMGRFGGGWQWNVGIQASTGWRCVIINLLVMSIRITAPRRHRASS